jgi:hypothetical protein
LKCYFCCTFASAATWHIDLCLRVHSKSKSWEAEMAPKGTPDIIPIYSCNTDYLLLIFFKVAIVVYLVSVFQQSIKLGTGCQVLRDTWVLLNLMELLLSSRENFPQLFTLWRKQWQSDNVVIHVPFFKLQKLHILVTNCSSWQWVCTFGALQSEPIRCIIRVHKFLAFLVLHQTFAPETLEIHLPRTLSFPYFGLFLYLWSSKSSLIIHVFLRWWRWYYLEDAKVLAYSVLDYAH